MTETLIANRVRVLFSHAEEHFQDGCGDLGLTLYLAASDLLPRVEGALPYLALVNVQRRLLEQHVVPIFLDPGYSLAA